MEGDRRLILVIETWSIDISGKSDENQKRKEGSAWGFEEIIDDG